MNFINKLYYDVQDELVKKQTQGLYVNQGRESTLIAAIGKPDHPSCVCGI